MATGKLNRYSKNPITKKIRSQAPKFPIIGNMGKVQRLDGRGLDFFLNKESGLRYSLNPPVTVL